jgi:hypothetical protein
MAKFVLPIEKFLITKIREHFPTFDLRQGTAFRDMLIKPSSILLQPYRDQANILKRNMSLQNFELMQEEELDSLVANVFVARRGGNYSEGTVRIYFTEAKGVTITTDMQFQTSTNLSFFPTETQTFLAEEVALNVDGFYFFVDVVVAAAAAGTEYNIPEHSIVFISNGPSGVVKVDNISSFSLGVDTEDNATLKQRTEYSIAVRDLVIKKSIQAVLLENFSTLREVVPIGYGDPEMMRDVIPVILNLLTLVEESTTGAITGGKYLSDSLVPNWHTIGIKPGHEVIIMNSPDEGTYSIESVTTSQIEIDGTLTNRTGVQYGLNGIVRDDAYHIGGKVDIYIDSTKLITDTVVLAPAQEINEVVEEALPYYEGGKAFTLPLVGINKIIEIDPVTREQIGDALVYGTDYTIVVADSLYRYSVKDSITINLLQTDPMQPRYYIGSTLEVDYYADDMVHETQDYCDNLLNRVITADILVRRAVPCFIDLTLSYKGDIAVEDLDSVLREYIDGLGIGTTLQASDIVATVYYFNVGFVSLAFTMVGETHKVDGTIVTQTSTTEIAVDRTVKYIPRTMNLTKVP